MSELRSYQNKAISDVRTAISEYRSAVLVCPTGSGKTKIAGGIARLATAKGNRVLFVTHRRELIRQIYDTLEQDCPGLQIGIEAAGFPSMPWAPLQIGSISSMIRRDYIAEPNLIIIDEAHHIRAKSWLSVLERFPNAYRLGLTATPQRLDQKGLGAVFTSMVEGPSIEELVKLGYLAPMRTLRPISQFNREQMRTDRNKEFRREDVAEQVTSAVVADGVHAYMRYARGRKAIIFAVHREHSRKIVAGLHEKGVAAAHLDGDDTMAHRDRIVNEWATGGIDVVSNVQLFDEGVDAPACEVVIDASPTRSITRYLQRAGRAMRPQEGKVALHLDLAGNSFDLGLPQDSREWSLEDGEITSEKTVAKKPRECVQCATLHYGRICPHCAFSTPMAGIDEVEAELVDARGVVKPKRRKPRMTRKELNRQLAQARRAPNPRQALEDIAKRNGYKAGWITAIERVWARAS